MTSLVNETDLAHRATELKRAFEQYEQALVDNDIEAMNAYFVDHEDIVRFGIADEQWGFSELVAWRRGAVAVPEGRALSNTQLQLLGDNTAVITTLFSYPGRAVRGRQTQVWHYCDGRWLIANAHVSEREF